MNSEPSFFERLTGSGRGDDATEELKRVNFPQDKKEEKTNAKPENAATEPPPEIPKTREPQTPQKEKQEQWIEEAQEGQLTIDVYQTDTEIVIKSTVAGVIAEDLDISITNDMVTIRGQRERDEKIPQEQYFYQECYWGPFSRTVILPADVSPDKTNAIVQNGILTIRLPKIEKEQTKKIKVKNGSVT